MMTTYTCTKGKTCETTKLG